MKHENDSRVRDEAENVSGMGADVAGLGLEGPLEEPPRGLGPGVENV